MGLRVSFIKGSANKIIELALARVDRIDEPDGFAEFREMSRARYRLVGIEPA